jgi:hypothetical protein
VQFQAKEYSEVIFSDQYPTAFHKARAYLLLPQRVVQSNKEYIHQIDSKPVSLFCP